MTRVNEERTAPKGGNRAAEHETVDDSPKDCGVLEYIRALAIWQDLLDRRYRQGFLAGAIIPTIVSILILLLMWTEIDHTVVKWCGRP